MVRVLLISSASVGPLFISALLKKEGHIVRRLYQGYKEYLGEPSAPFLPPLTEEELREFRPDVIGFSADTSCFDRAVEMASEIKTILPSVYIVFGGPHPTVCPDEAIGKASIDAICVGEGEYAMLELCNEIQVQKAPITVKNLWVQHNGEIYKNPQRPYSQDLDSIPMDREGIWYSGIYTGRGCVGRCTFCNVPTIRKCGPGGKYFRKRSFESVLDEVQIVYDSILKRSSPALIVYKLLGRKKWVEPLRSKDGTFLGDQKWFLEFAKRLRKRFPMSIVDKLLAPIVYKLLGRKKWAEPLRFKDDTFLGDRKWFLEFAKRLRKRFPNLTYLCQATANEIDEEVADWLKKSGCVQVLLGLETGSAKLRNDLLRKNVTDKQISTACRLLREQGIQILGSWMYGLPGETFPDMLRTFIMSVKEGDSSNLSFLTPLPGTELFDMAVAEGIIDANYHHGGVYRSVVLHKGEARLQVLMVSLIHALKDVRIPYDYRYIRRLGSRSDWRGKTIGEIIAEEMESAINSTHDNDGGIGGNQS
jgi:radical SAM superfamily enzyme YgiQ (UPF0313 family)